MTLGVWAITQKAVHAYRFDCPSDNQKKQVVDDQLRHTAVQICRVGASLNSIYLSLFTPSAVGCARRHQVSCGTSINVGTSSFASRGDSCSQRFQSQSLQHALCLTECADDFSGGGTAGA